MAIDYGKVGLVCGIEIHQQIETGKLFCRCPSQLEDKKADILLLRELHAVAGESGNIDVAALHEQLKGKTFAYEGYNKTTCLVEADEEPPHPINEESLAVVLQVCKLVGARVPNVAQVMRKTVIDGSNTSGFQRTCLIGRGGSIMTSEGKVRLQTICVEEDSARPIREEKDYKVYRLDRLGIPLVEIATDPDIRTPSQCKEAAEKIGMILRSTKKVKRGLGTIRQDVNVSIKGGVRVEIKGAQDLKMLPTLIDNEILRQQNLIHIQQQAKRAKEQATTTFVDLTRVFNHTPSTLVKNALNKDGVVMGVKLPGFFGLIGCEPSPGIRLGKELSYYAQAAAPVRGILHSDELPKFGITKEEVELVRKKLECKKDDAFVLCLASPKVAKKALAGVVRRVLLCVEGVPGEVRRANPDGTTTFLRPMPGAARMYPETDVPLIYPSLDQVDVVELIEEKQKRFEKKYSLSSDLATLVAKSDHAELFEEIIKKHKDIKPAYVAETLTSTLKELKTKYHIDPLMISDDDFRDLFKHLHKGDLHKDVVTDALVDYAQGQFSLEVFKSHSTEDLHKKLVGIIKKNPGAPFGAYMGMAMKELKGKASGEKISEMLKELLKDHGHGPGKKQEPITSPVKKGKKEKTKSSKKKK